MSDYAKAMTYKCICAQVNKCVNIKDNNTSGYIPAKNDPAFLDFPLFSTVEKVSLSILQYIRNDMMSGNPGTSKGQHCVCVCIPYPAARRRVCG